jgi:hypothetical protein
MGQLVGVLLTWGSYIQALVILNDMMIIVFDLLHVVALAVLFIAQAQAGDKFVRFRDLLH